MEDVGENRDKATKEIKGRRARSIIRVNGKLKEKGG
jgi:hypothetical protein